ncbi:SHOCT domain-containing protein [Fodinibius sp.]|uniref:SHOCT domain-containing protein n=1 Tax=Fodinibius sp. TaxID=1872440 RepID=UPI003567F89F
MHDFNFFGGGWMMFFWWFLIIVLVVFAIRALIRAKQNNRSKETPMDILERRYANGEIDEEEFNKRKQELLK